MYTELTTITEAEGKTVQSITRALFGGQMVIAFIDETFLTLGAVHDYDDDVYVYQQELDFMNFGADKLVASGIISEEERHQKVLEIREEGSRRRGASELRKYELLKAKFEGGQS